MIIKFEKMKDAASFPESLQSETKQYVEAVRKLVSWLATDPEHGAEQRSTWFGSRNPPAVAKMLTNVDNYLNQRCVRLTFVSNQEAAPAKRYRGQVWPTVVIAHAPDNYWVGGKLTKDGRGKHERRLWGDLMETETDEDFRKDGGYLRVPSGLRIMMGASYMAGTKFPDPKYDGPNTNVRVKTIFHEMTHKILKTKDHKYSYRPCQDLALSDAATAMTNADNWGFFMDGVYKTDPL